MAGTDNLKPWKPGQSGNPKGRPKKIVGFVNDELQKAGLEKLASSQVTDIYEGMLALDRKTLLEISKRDDVPMIYRIIAKEMLGNRGFNAVERMLDRAHGKAEEKTPQNPVLIQILNEMRNEEKPNKKTRPIVEGENKREG